MIWPTKYWRKTMGGNLPPGVTEGMIPGNRPEDLEMDEVIDWMLCQPLEPIDIQQMVIGYLLEKKLPMAGEPPIKPGPKTLMEVFADIDDVKATEGEH